MGQPTSAYWQRANISQFHHHSALISSTKIGRPESSFAREMRKTSLLTYMVVRKLNTVRILDEHLRNIKLSWKKNSWDLGRYFPKSKTLNIGDVFYEKTKVTFIGNSSTMGSIETKRYKDVSKLRWGGLDRIVFDNKKYYKFKKRSKKRILGKVRRLAGGLVTRVTRSLAPKVTIKESRRALKKIQPLIQNKWYGFGLFEPKMSWIDVFGFLRGGSKLCLIRIMGQRPNLFDAGDDRELSRLGLTAQRREDRF